MQRGAAHAAAGPRRPETSRDRSVARHIADTGERMTGRIDAFVGAHAYAGERLAPRPLTEGDRRSLGELGYGPGQGR